MTGSLLTRFYRTTDDFFLLIREDGAFVIEAADEQEPPRDPAETILRLFSSPTEVKEYRSRNKTPTKIGKTTLEELWPLLERLNEASERSFNCPLAVEISGLSASGEVITVEQLHSAHRIPD